MTQPPAARRSDALRLRILSALVMLPLALAAVWFGPPWIGLIVALAGLAMAWEWGRLSGDGRFGAGEAIIIVTVLLAVVAAWSGRFQLALALTVVGAVVASVVRPVQRMWAGLGTIWIAAGCVAFLWLAMPAIGGRSVILWVLAVVWATDILAYVAGKTIGGPRLAPQLSPNKTWSGTAGGLLGAAAAGAIAALWSGSHAMAGILLLSLLFSIAAQAGDLAESWAKRHFAVKDASSLIPGHGGALDRLDGLLAAAILAALLTLILGSGVLTLG